MVDFQVLFNIAITGLGAIFGWLLNSIWQEIKASQESDKAIIERISKMEVLVAGDYVKKTEFTHVMDKLFGKLDDISKQINSKADKP